MIVSEIISLNTKKSKVIFQDGESLALYNGEIRRLDIAVGKEIDEEEYYTSGFKKESFCKADAYT